MLAAGESRRWGPDNKLLAPIAGEPMVRRVVEMALASAARPVVVVTGHEEEAVIAALDCLPVTLVRASDFTEGMAASLRAGIAAVPEDCVGALVCLGDMPFAQPATLDRLAAEYDPAEGLLAAVPLFVGKQGNPVLLGRALFAEIAKLTGDRGARGLLAGMPDRVAEIPVDDPGVLRDIDRPESLSL